MTAARWEDAATGLVVTYMVLKQVDPVERGEHNRVPRPIEGPQFAVTRQGFMVGHARTADELAALGVSAATVAAIVAAARWGLVLGTCDADGYTEVGTMGDERYWHCEDAAVVIDPEGLELCARHAEEYWPDLIPGLI